MLPVTPEACPCVPSRFEAYRSPQKEPTMLTCGVTPPCISSLYYHLCMSIRYPVLAKFYKIDVPVTFLFIYLIFLPLFS